MRGFSLKPFRSGSDSKIDLSRSSDNRKASDPCIEKVQPGSQRSLTAKKKVTFKETVPVMDSVTLRKNTASAFNEGMLVTERCMLKKADFGGANRSKLQRCSSLDEKCALKLAALEKNKKSPCHSVEYIRIRSASHKKISGNELDLSKHLTILSAFYPNIQHMKHEDLCISRRKGLLEQPDRSSGLLIGIDEALHESQKKQTVSCAA